MIPFTNEYCSEYRTPSLTKTSSALTGLSRRLVDKGLLKERQAMHAQMQARQDNVPLVNYLSQHHIVDALKASQAAAEEFGLPLFDIDALDLDPDVQELIDERLIQEFNALPLWRRGNRLFVAITDPGNLHALDQFKFQSGLNTEPVLVETHALLKRLEESLEQRGTSMMGLSDTDLDALQFEGINDETPQGDADVEDAPLVRFVNKILLDAIQRGASDIHFEPYENRTRVRYRLDGILQEAATPPVSLAPRIVARIKVMARLDISEKRLPQDGRIKMNLSKNRSIDFRVSSCPTLFGEKVVLRILDSGSFKYGIDVLGFDERQKQVFVEHIKKPHGMVLVTGPTGSGKTVTLYTAMNILNTGDRNISSVEDPAEIYMPGINQVNINPKVGLTFASTLRAFLRQDPDIIMVGEIRDTETAEIALKAAQTGHLVLSTLHTNDAPQTLTRLMNMGVEPYNIVSSVSLIVAQRLARRLCAHCKQIIELPEEILMAQGFKPEQLGRFTLYAPAGCERCNNGYRGRLGIFQVMPMSEAMGRLILNGGNHLQLADQAREEGIVDLRQAGLEKVMQGLTSLEEIHRVTME
ncbi:MAG: type IV-A pilus assembly ATPase PilB [Gammaproteobacteria bacterium]|nr:type IV-A pilus assembly ATPase PilB [Gammaproteobacteria bacterium]